MERAEFEVPGDPRDQSSRVDDIRSPLKTDVHSPFILNIPQSQSERSSQDDMVHRCQSPDDQQLSDGETDLPHMQDPTISKSSANHTWAESGPRMSKRSHNQTLSPSLPSGVTRGIVKRFTRQLGIRRGSIRKLTLKAIMGAGDLFFRQLSRDLVAFSNHAGRKRIDESDVIAVMKR